MMYFNLFKKKQFIFSINTGRAGSEYLSSILATAEGVWADHEPDPKMVGDILRFVTDKSYQESYDARIYKASAIKTILTESSYSVYAETSHMFIKTFFDVVISELSNIKVVFLKRNLIDTLYSFYKLGYFSVRNKYWKDWMISPYSVTSAIPCFLGKDEQDEIGLSLAYLIDIYARAHRFIDENPKVPVFHITLEELNNEAKVKELFLKLKIKPTEATFKQIGLKVNEKTERKKEIGSNEVSKEYLRERCISYIEKLKTNGYDVSKIIIT